MIGAPEECPRQMPGVTKPEGMAAYEGGRNLDDVLLETYRTHYGE